MARISGAICQVSPICVKYLTRQLDRQAALHLELAVDAGLRLLQHLVGQVGGDDLDAPAGDAIAQFLQRHGERIGLLPGRRGGAPDADAALRAPAPPSSAGMIVSRKCSNGILSRKKNDSLVVIASTTSTASASAFGPRSRCTRSVRPARAGPARDRQQPALDQILLVGRQNEAGAFPQQPAQIVVIVRRHDRPPENRRMTRGPI